MLLIGNGSNYGINLQLIIGLSVASGLAVILIFSLIFFCKKTKIK